jgi:tRNA threonylcarbamoyladenosine biosynthesis protein TsaB
VAVADSTGRLLAASELPPVRESAESVVAVARAMLDEHGIGPWAIGAIGVDVGPGLFTSLRVGLAVARMLGAALGVGVAGARSTELLLHAALETHAPERSLVVVAAVDVRRGELAWEARVVGTSDGLRGAGNARAVFAGGRQLPAGSSPWLGSHGSGVARAHAEAFDGLELGSPKQLAQALEQLLAGGGTDVLIVGDGALRYGDLFVSAGARVGPDTIAAPSAAVLARLVATGVVSLRSPLDVLPLYLREPDTRLGWTRRPDAGAVLRGQGAPGEAVS